MEVNCFDKLIQISDYEIEGRRYIDCVIRKQRILLLPEEEVRQAILVYLIRYTNINEDNYIFKVEHNNLDIAVYYKNKLNNFQPVCSPILIIEVKRKNENLSNHEAQILKYLEINSCTHGLLTNSQKIFLYSVKNNFKKRHFEINSLNQYLEWYKPDDDIDLFESAENGNIESFMFLIKKYGKTCKFNLVFTGYETPIDIFWVSQINDFIFFDFCGIYKKKQPRINKNNFVRLISIF